MTADLDKEELEKRKKLFGKFREGFRTLRPYRLPGKDTQILEMPVTTMPVFKLPIQPQLCDVPGAILEIHRSSLFQFPP